MHCIRRNVRVKTDIPCINGEKSLTVQNVLRIFAGIDEKTGFVKSRFHVAIIFLCYVINMKKGTRISALDNIGEIG